MAVSLRQVSDGRMYAGGPGGDYYSMAMPGQRNVTSVNPLTPAQQQGYYGTALPGTAQPSTTETRAPNTFTAPTGMLPTSPTATDTRTTNPFLNPTGVAGQSQPATGGTPYNPAGDGYTGMTGNYTIRQPASDLLSRVSPVDLMALRTLGSSSDFTQTLGILTGHLRALGMSEDEIRAVINQGMGASGQGAITATNGLASQLSASGQPFSIFNGTDYAPMYANSASGLTPAGKPMPTAGATTPAPASGATGQGMTGQPISDPSFGGTGSTANGTGLDINSFYNPNTQFLVDQGTRAIQNSAAAKGGLLSGSTLKGISDYAQNTAQAQSYLPALQAAMNEQNFNRNAFTNDRDYARGVVTGDRSFNEGQREFNTGTDLADRQFAYTAANNDQTQNFNHALQMAQLGLQGTQGNSQLAGALATLQAQLGIGAAQAQGAGTVGANNAVTNAISQMLSYMMGNNAVNSVTPH